MLVIVSAENFTQPYTEAKRTVLVRSTIEFSSRRDAFIGSWRINGLDCITLFISEFDSKYISEKLHPSNGIIPAIQIGFLDSNILIPKGFLKSYSGIIIGRRAYSSTESFRLDIPILNAFFFANVKFHLSELLVPPGFRTSIPSILNLPKRGPC